MEPQACGEELAQRHDRQLRAMAPGQCRVKLVRIRGSSEAAAPLVIKLLRLSVPGN
jgi:hypothetical protein